MTTSRRASISKENETIVLTQSRRRCAMCFGLNRDTMLKNGQIAHIDRNPTRSESANLVFLCFDHHDEYDSRTSQRKGLTPGELRVFKSELIDAVGRAFRQNVHFGQLLTPPSDPYAGQYTRLGGDHDSAEIVLTPLPDTPEGSIRYFVSGFALWGTNREYGPNMGDLSFVGLMDEKDKIIFSRQKIGGGIAITALQFLGDGILTVTEDDWIAEYGMNVNFIGDYARSIAPL